MKKNPSPPSPISDGNGRSSSPPAKMGEVSRAAGRRGLITHTRTTPSVFLHAKELRHNPTPAEARLWSFLRSHRSDRLGFRRQHAIGQYIADFCCPRKMLIIELDGSQHLEQEDYDADRTADLEVLGYRVLRFWNNDVMNDIDGVMRAILEAMN